MGRTNRMPTVIAMAPAPFRTMNPTPSPNSVNETIESTP